ncbi:MAG: DUF2291 domain-containing protein [Bryobacteraceae bacterium]|nr:DUF2291 domain-containing protein [Bryobacteraceae bacterium]
MNRTPRAVAVLGLMLVLASCVPWTVRPIGGDATPAAAAVASSDPVAYVDSIWSSRLLPAVLNTAVDARELLTALAASPSAARQRYCLHYSGSGAYCVVKGEGIVTSIDNRSRVGLAFVDIAPFDGRPDVSIQIGPVLSGNALRDATGIVRFSDFVNQLQFADAGNEINNRVLKSVLAPLDPKRLKGQTVSFAGALPATDHADPPLAGLVPVLLTIKERR